MTGVAVAGMTLLMSISRVHADSHTPLSGSHKQQIISNCTSVKSSLNQLHRSDASLRVNRGQMYEVVGTKLMARLNGRLVANRLDASTLVSTAARYDTALLNFRDTYKRYEEQLSTLLRVDCTKQPETFYRALLDVRAKRTEVHKSVTNLNSIMSDYHQDFIDFSNEYETATKRISND